VNINLENFPKMARGCGKERVQTVRKNRNSKPEDREHLVRDLWKK